MGSHDTSVPAPDQRVLVLGASGYVGGRLVPELLRSGVAVRCMSRSPDAVRAIAWGDKVEVMAGDLLDPQSLAPVFDDIDVVVYLVHSLDTGDGFEELERECAANARRAAEQAGVQRIVYLSGLGADDEELSPHLRSRHTVGRELAAGPTEVIELRAAIVIGAGSASFEMLRSLVEVLPVMITPTWVTRTKVQPIAIVDVLIYLKAAIAAPPSEGHTVVQIGGPDRLTYRELIDLYAEVADLPGRVILPVPVITPRLSSHWVNVVTPLPRNLASSLVDSLRHDVVVTDNSASRLSDHQPLDARTAIGLSIVAVKDLRIPARWSGLAHRTESAQPRPWDPDWSGGTVYEDRREMITSASAGAVMTTVTGIGGDRGWYGFGPLWKLRGLADKLVGGVGLRRGRRHPDLIIVGEALDFWRVDALEPNLFRLRAEMKLPGDAWLEWSIDPAPKPTDPGALDGSTETADVTESGGSTTTVVQRARFVPIGLWGRLYWYGLFPFHGIIFPMLLRRLVAAAEAAERDDRPGGDPDDRVVAGQSSAAKSSEEKKLGPRMLLP
jgi:uncharacterized protein YbjT (DUF2867 family)